ncbi:MAG: hypothetical protein QXG91_02185 [Candidatus Aenigmatarchaeota archaeon]
MAVTTPLQIGTDFIIFYSVFSLAIFISYFGRKQEEDKLTADWFSVFAGVLLLSFLQLAVIAKNLMIIDESIYFILRISFVLLSSLLITYGLVSIIVRKVLEQQTYLKKYNEIKEAILAIKEKFLKGKISSDEFKEILKDFIKEEALLEVKLKKKKK